MATWYDAAAARESGGIARRSPGCSIPLLGASELAEAKAILNADKILFYRVGPDLVGIVHFEQAAALYYCPKDSPRPSVAAKAVKLMADLERAQIGRSQENRLAMMGMTGMASK